MKTTIITITICTALYAGMGAITKTTSQLTKHNQELNIALAMLEK
ncbi:hypothetical protein SAMN06313486_10147 [Epsilonproteobacteria bacterium SCGC AD-308-P11]|jgi:hypothetical protein|nr:hypothetical protein SAMN06313486_10147 [Epsilonproteobacteria bacterium SCGC AD-308-P11]